MPWNKNDYPPSMKNLDPRIREKAVEIANALLDDGYEEGRSIAIATAQAKEWNENHPEGENKKENRSSQKNGPVHTSRDHRNLHVVPHEDGWAIKQEGKEQPKHTYRVKKEAEDAAKEMASSKQIRVIVHDKQGKILTSTAYD
ncbi:DUF2188 domain-containing protein [Neobacillus mesonae]|nr:DUF2188 domain-containing protein [Neobacillus mesonae]